MNQYELIEFFGVLPEINEEDCYEFYRVVKDYSILEMTFFYPQDIYITIFQRDSLDEIFSTTLKGNIKVERLVYKNNYDCLELTIPYLGSYGGAEWIYSFILRIFVEPNIKVEILR